jgi:hypothetical protein
MACLPGLCKGWLIPLGGLIRDGEGLSDGIEDLIVNTYFKRFFVRKDQMELM